MIINDNIACRQYFRFVIMFTFVFTDAPDVTAAMWPPQTIAGNLPPHIARPWVDTAANPALWLGQRAFNVSRPTDTTQLPLAPHTELKLVQHPITGQLYIIPSRTLCSHSLRHIFIIIVILLYIMAMLSVPATSNRER